MQAQYEHSPPTRSRSTTATAQPSVGQLAGAVPGPHAGQDGQMDAHDGRRDPDSALILEGIRALHDRLSELEHRVVPGERPGFGGHPGPGFTPAWKRPTAGEARWQVTVAVAVAVALQFRLPGGLVLLHPVWLLPALEGLLHQRHRVRAVVLGVRPGGPVPRAHLPPCTRTSSSPR